MPELNTPARAISRFTTNSVPRKDDFSVLLYHLPCKTPVVYRDCRGEKKFDVLWVEEQLVFLHADEATTS